MRDYQESVNIVQIEDGETDAGQSDPCVQLWFAGDTKSMPSWQWSYFLLLESKLQNDISLRVLRKHFWVDPYVRCPSCCLLRISSHNYASFVEFGLHETVHNVSLEEFSPYHILQYAVVMTVLNEQEIHITFCSSPCFLWPHPTLYFGSLASHFSFLHFWFGRYICWGLDAQNVRMVDKVNSIRFSIVFPSKCRLVFVDSHNTKSNFHSAFTVPMRVVKGD